MNNNYVIPAQGKEALDLLRKYYNLQNVAIIHAINPYAGAPGIIPRYERDKQIGTSVLGTPVYVDLSLMGCAWSDTTRPQNTDGTYPITSLPDGAATPQERIYMNLQTVIITLSQAYKVVETEIQGRDGTVKEYIGKADAGISIQGIIVGQNGVYPRKDVIALKAWCDAPVSKRVVSWWLNNIGVHNVVVKNVDIPQVAGGYSYQPFTLSCSSDAPVELRTSQPPQSVV